MSGGIDSAVSAMLLQEQGFKCVGVFMKNWDSSDALGKTACNISQDYEDMKLVCKKLKIEAIEVFYVLL